MRSTPRPNRFPWAKLALQPDVGASFSRPMVGVKSDSLRNCRIALSPRQNRPGTGPRRAHGAPYRGTALPRMATARIGTKKAARKTPAKSAHQAPKPAPWRPLSGLKNAYFPARDRAFARRIPIASRPLMSVPAIFFSKFCSRYVDTPTRPS